MSLDSEEERLGGYDLDGLDRAIRAANGESALKARDEGAFRDIAAGRAIHLEGTARRARREHAREQHLDLVAVERVIGCVVRAS